MKLKITLVLMLLFGVWGPLSLALGKPLRDPWMEISGFVFGGALTFIVLKMHRPVV